MDINFKIKQETTAKTPNHATFSGFPHFTKFSVRPNADTDKKKRKKYGTL